MQMAKDNNNLLLSFIIESHSDIDSVSGSKTLKGLSVHLCFVILTKTSSQKRTCSMNQCVAPVTRCKKPQQTAALHAYILKYFRQNVYAIKKCLFLLIHNTFEIYLSQENCSSYFLRYPPGNASCLVAILLFGLYNSIYIRSRRALFAYWFWVTDSMN